MEESARIVRASAFRVAASAMLGGVFLSALALAVKAAHWQQAQTAQESSCSRLELKALCLSAAICAIAYWNYSQAVHAVCMRGAKDVRDATLRVDDIVLQCRYADWLVTMPLLAVKVLEMARTDGSGCASSSDAPYVERGMAALLAFLMICSGGVVAAAGCCCTKRCVAVLAVGMCSLVALLALILREALESDSGVAATAVCFAFVWCAYPVVFFCVELRSSGEQAAACRSRCWCDTAYAALDVVSKPLLAAYTVLSALD